MTIDPALRSASIQALTVWQAIYPEAALRLGDHRSFPALAAAMDDLRTQVRS